MNRKLSRLAAAGIMGFALFTGSFSASAAPAWSLPESGLQMDNASKQAYIYKEMYASFHPAKDAKPVSHPFEVPDDWTYTRLIWAVSTWKTGESQGLAEQDRPPASWRRIHHAPPC